LFNIQKFSVISLMSLSCMFIVSELSFSYSRIIYRKQLPVLYL